MNEFCNFIGENFFGAINFGVFETAKAINFVHRNKRQQTQASFNVGIIDIAPVLIEIKRRNFIGVEPQRTARSLAHFRAVRFEEQFICKPVSRASGFTASEFDARDNVRPLIIAAALENTIIIAVEFIKIVSLHNHIIKFQEG